MSAIIYRAPDSTGIAKFGDMADPISLRKNLGSVAGLFEVLENNPINRPCDRNVLSIWQSGDMDPPRMQKRLIEYEGLPLEMFNNIQSGRASWPVFEDLISRYSTNQMSVYPGCPGNPYSLQRFTVRSRNDLRRVVETMLKTYDLSFVAIKSIFRAHLEKGINALGKAKPVKASVADIYNAFDHLFQLIFEEYRPVEFTRQSYKRVHMNPFAKKYIWQLISGIPVKIPEDFDNDGIKNLFRLLDEALLSRIHTDSGISEEIQKNLNYSLKGDYESASIGWSTLYHAEKGVNVYGRASAAVLEWMQKNEILQSMSMSISSGSSAALSAPMGVTGPKCLNYLVQPVLTQGRWALQSEVTLKNAHPFVDENRNRSIVLNGQFAASVEDEMRDFLSGVVRVPFRSDNSSEYFALLWGYYFDVLKNEKRQFQQVKDQVENGLEEYAVGSNTINYQIFKHIKDKENTELDEVAFIEAARRFTKNGGQIAVAGISVESPRTIYAVSNNRPLFIVRRRETHDYMVVSDINASLGLFSQLEIMEVTKAYESLLKQRDLEIKQLNRQQAPKEEIEKCRQDRDAEIDSVLTRFAVDVYALEGENLFARIATEFKNSSVERTVEITDFEGKVLHDIEPYRINLTPPHVHKDLDKSFYKTHLEEVPELLENMVENVLNSGSNINGFSINEKYLKRRFGENLGGIKRIFIAGMGTSYHAALGVSGFFRSMFPDTRVIILQPVEIDLMKGMFVPEEDLVLLLSWSSTTAEMVKLSKELSKTNVLFIGVTEKIFGDMALVARKSCGVVYVMSGEEVTVSAVKSTFCCMMSLVLFSLYVCRDMIRQQVDWSVTGGIMQVSHYLKSMADDGDLEDRAARLASQYAASDGFILIDAVHSTGAAREAVLKMEEMTWSLVGRAIDYDDVNLGLLKDAGRRSFLVINATCSKRFSSALELMKTLHMEDIPFCAVAFDGTETDRIREYSAGNLVLLPKVEDNLQPFVDLMFYYILAFHFGRAAGRKADDYPRNRAKSVTTSRSVGYEQSSSQGEFFLLRHKEQLLGEMGLDSQDLAMTTHLEKVIRNEPFAGRIQEIKKLASVIREEDAFERLV
ncbi:MAG: SIS domain-containing protein, partial [Thermodesulfobacteriota bacterium]